MRQKFLQYDWYCVCCTNQVIKNASFSYHDADFVSAIAECTIVEALNSATLHPAQLLGITGKKGTLDFGSDADFVFLDDDLNVVSTYVAGECVWRSPSITSVTGNSL